jgi:hypothetical protein
MGGKKFAWVPIRRENLARDDATCEKAKHGCTNDTGAEDAFMHAGLEANVCAHSEKEVVPASMASTSEPINAYVGLSPRGSVKVGAAGKAAYGFKIGEYQSTEGVVSSIKISSDAGPGSVNREDPSTGEKGLDNKFVASSRTR